MPGCPIARFAPPWSPFRALSDASGALCRPRLPQPQRLPCPFPRLPSVPLPHFASNVAGVESDPDILETSAAMSLRYPRGFFSPDALNCSISMQLEFFEQRFEENFAVSHLFCPVCCSASYNVSRQTRNIKPPDVNHRNQPFAAMPSRLASFSMTRRKTSYCFSPVVAAISRTNLSASGVIFAVISFSTIGVYIHQKTA